jgi:hypothetical protein
MKIVIARKVVWAIGLSISAATLPLQAIAQQGQGPMYGQMRSMGPGGGMFGMFRVIDQDGDGVIVPDEAAARHEEVFAVMDADDSGALTEEEFLAVRMGPGPGQGTVGPRHEQMMERRTVRFKTMDADGDGEVSKADFMASGQENFEASDLNQDGKVTVWEFRSRRRF